MASPAFREKPKDGLPFLPNDYASRPAHTPPAENPKPSDLALTAPGMSSSLLRRLSRSGFGSSTRLGRGHLNGCRVTAASLSCLAFSCSSLLAQHYSSSLALRVARSKLVIERVLLSESA